MTEKKAKVIDINQAKIKKLVWCPRCQWGGLLESEPDGSFWCDKCTYRFEAVDD